MAMSRSENMSRIKSSNTSIELMLRKELWSRGLRYRINCKKVIGKPDICFLGKKVAVFCDSEFWHGKDYSEGKVPKSNQEYWIPKIERNINRDKTVNESLRSQEWVVMRFWGKDIMSNVEKVADLIEETLNHKTR